MIATQQTAEDMVRRVKEALDAGGKDAAVACFGEVCLEQDWTQDELQQAIAVIRATKQ